LEKRRRNFNELGVGMVRSERSELANMSLISFSFLDNTTPMYPSSYLRLYPSAETREQSSIPLLNCRALPSPQSIVTISPASVGVANK
jgi:hypothetical protein